MGQNLFVDDNLFGYDKKNEATNAVWVEYSCPMEEGMIFPPHWHEELILIYVKSGMLLLECNGRGINMQSDSVAIINPNELHSGRKTDAKLEYYIIKMDLLKLIGTNAEFNQFEYTERLLKNQIRFENEPRQDQVILGIVKHLVEEFERREEGYQLAIKGFAYQLLSILMRHFIKSGLSQSELEFHYRRLSQIKPAIIYMEAHMADKILLTQLAEEAHLSTIQFSRVFKTISGYSPMDYLNHLRIQKAVKLLLNTDKTMIEVAMEIGFTDSNYFSRIFKKYRNLSPSEFREKYVRE